VFFFLIVDNQFFYAMFLVCSLLIRFDQFTCHFVLSINLGRLLGCRSFSSGLQKSPSMLKGFSCGLVGKLLSNRLG
jgi:hypothetical protein